MSAITLTNKNISNPLQFGLPESMDEVLGRDTKYEILTDEYSPNGDVLVESAFTKWNKMQYHRTGDAKYTLTPNEITALMREIIPELHWKLKATTLIPVVPLAAGQMRYKYYVWGGVPGPRKTLSFEGGKTQKPKKTETIARLQGFDYDFHFTKPELDASRGGNGIESFSESLDMATVRILREHLALARDWFYFRGTDNPYCVYDTSITGILNDANLTDPGAMGIGADDILTDVGDVSKSATKLANFLMQRKFEPPFTLDMTPGVFSQALDNINATSSKTDYILIKEMAAPEGGNMFDKIRLNPFLIDSETETNATGSMACYKALQNGVKNFKIVESYAPGYYPIPPQGLGVSGKLLFMGKAIVPRPTSIAYVDELTINTL